MDLAIDGQPNQSDAGGFQLTITGPLEAVSQVIRILAWALSVFRKPGETKLNSFEAEVTLRQKASEDSAPALAIEIDKSHTDQDFGDGMCWHGIFHDFAVSASFPVPPRTGARGIELPFNLMSLLARVDYPLPHDYGFILKGQRSALIPRRTFKEANGRLLVQWHPTQSSDKSVLSMENVSSPVVNLQPTFSHISGIVSEDNRHILGMYDVSAIDFGTKSWQDQKFSTYLRSGHVKSQGQGWSFGWQRSISLTASGSVLGFASFGASTAFIPRLSRTLVKRLDGDLTLTELVDHACKELTVVYDTWAKLAWLLPEICVIFQLMQLHAVSKEVSSSVH